jgi:hypothetical protein
MTAIATLEPPQTSSLARPGFSPTAGWLSGRGFDLVLVAGTAGLALMVAAGLAIEPALFGAILLADLWLLGYHHVAAMFARLLAEPDGLKKYRALVTWVPLAVIAAVAGLALGVGEWTLPAIYLYWQWWHYTRQSYGVAQLYRLKTGQAQYGLGQMKALIYAVPFAGILNRSYQGADEFLGMELRTVPVPEVAVTAALAIAGGVIAWWAFGQLRAWREGHLAYAYNLYLLTHLTIFSLAYFVFPSIEHGWLVVNVWHNSQYLLVVWLFNNKRFKDQVDPGQRLLSTLCRRRNVPAYFGVVLAVSTLSYLAIGGTLTIFSASALPLALIVAQVINIHHYIVDSQIWKVRRPQVRADMGISRQAA